MLEPRTKCFAKNARRRLINQWRFRHSSSCIATSSPIGRRLKPVDSNGNISVWQRQSRGREDNYVIRWGSEIGPLTWRRHLPWSIWWQSLRVQKRTRAGHIWVEKVWSLRCHSVQACEANITWPFQARTAKLNSTIFPNFNNWLNKLHCYWLDCRLHRLWRIRNLQGGRLHCLGAAKDLPAK